MLVLTNADWPEVVQGLKPGEHVVAFGDLYLAALARASGLEMRDSLAHVFPGGWHPIFIFRKPVEGTVAETVLKHGVGGLNIDACRTRCEGGSPSQKHRETARRTGVVPLPGRTAGEDKVLGKIGRRGSPEAYLAEHSGENIGRWPTNLVFTHAEGCRRLGTKRVLAQGGDTAVVRQSAGYKGPSLGKDSRKPGNQRPSYRQGGLETIAAWDCAPGCPVKALDEMSGHSTTPETVTRGAGGQHGAYHPIGEQRDVPCYGDAGGASRFFPQFRNETELLAWIKALIGE